MKGCLKIFVLILVFSTLLVLIVGGFCCFNFNNITSQFNDNSPASISTRASSIIPIKQNDQFRPIKSFDFLGVKAGLFSDDAEEQYAAIADTGWVFPLKSDELDQELNKNNLEKLLSQSGEKDVKIEKIDIIKKGKIKVNGNEIPYTHLKALVNDTVEDRQYTMEGAIGVIKYQGKNILFISGTAGKKYKHHVTEDFLKTLDIS